MSSVDSNKNNSDIELTKSVDDTISYTYDEAVELAGHGPYNYLVLLACSVISLAVAMDMFGFSVVVAAASCDLRLSITITGLLNSTPLSGILFAFPWGYYADTRGRRRALLISTTVGFVFAALSSFSYSWQMMIVLKFIGCVFSSASYTLTMTYLGECTGSKRRNRYLFLMNSANLAAEFIFYSLAYIILPLDFSYPISFLGITLRPWRVYSILISMPLGIGALILIFLYESPKLLASRGKNDEALVVLKKIYERNGGKRHEYPVTTLAETETKNTNSQSFWGSIVKQTVPLFKPPLLWRTIQLFYLISLCGTTNNVFLMWYPMMVNLFFNSFASGLADDRSFCDRVVTNISTIAPVNSIQCDDTISPNTIYSGIILGLTFATINLAASAVAFYRRLVLIASYIVSGVCLASVELLREPVTNMVAFTVVQCTVIGIGSIASYFNDLYPTANRGLVTSLGIMFSRILALISVNVVGVIIADHCSIIFYFWTVYVASGIVVALFLPSDSKPVT